MPAYCGAAVIFDREKGKMTLDNFAFEGRRVPEKKALWCWTNDSRSVAFFRAVKKQTELPPIRAWKI
jgi:hypothetical protein